MFAFIRSPVFFPALSMLLAGGSTIGYLRAGDWSKAAYWFLGGSITYIVTFCLKS